MSGFKHVIIGVGAGVLQMHRPALIASDAQLVGVSDVNETLGQARASELDCPYFADYREMLSETRPDIAVILTPHPFHAEIAIACLQAGAHVLVEKPIAIEVREADAMLAAAEASGRRLAVSFQHRFRPEVRAAKALLEAGTLGRLQHVDMTVNWFRSAAYFGSSPWRATWRGEGGGVLMNQAPHNLDLLCHLIGSPQRVIGWTRNQLHAIEVEDTVQAMLEWSGGCLGSLHISTAEAGRAERLEIVGSAGVMQLHSGGLQIALFEAPLERFAKESQSFWDAPKLIPQPISLPDGPTGHCAVYAHFHSAIRHGTPLIISGAEGRKSLELANALTYSSACDAAVTLPLDAEKYHALLEARRRQSHTASSD